MQYRKKDITMSISYTDSDVTFNATLQAAPLVPATSTSSLPPAIGTVQFERLDPEKHRLPATHPLQEQFPHITIAYYAMIVEERFLQQRADGRGPRGLALWMNYAGSSLCASVTSENGRNGIAPVSWGIDPETPDPAAKSDLLWLHVTEGTRKATWQNHMLHGYKGRYVQGRYGYEHSFDWRDGVPVNVADMYDPNLGMVQQSIFVPKDARGLGMAEQSMSPADLRQTYTITVWAPTSELKELATQIQKQPELTYRGGGSRGGLESYGGPAVLGVDDMVAKGGNMRSMPQSMSVESDYKMAVGGKIRQHIIKNPFSRTMFQADPCVAIVCFPVTEQRANDMFKPSTAQGRSFQTF
jgi:hypothetical protein